MSQKAASWLSENVHVLNALADAVGADALAELDGGDFAVFPVDLAAEGDIVSLIRAEYVTPAPERVAPRLVLGPEKGRR